MNRLIVAEFVDFGAAVGGARGRWKEGRGIVTAGKRILYGGNPAATGRRGKGRRLVDPSEPRVEIPPSKRVLILDTLALAPP